MGLKFLTLISLLVLLMTQVSCRPQLGADDPLLLRFEKDSFENLHRLRKLSESQGLRVFWWNVAWGHFNSKGDLDHNLYDLITSNARPDIIILGEFKESVLNTSTHNVLKKHFSYQSFTPYQLDSPEVGIKVYSTSSLTASKRFVLPWYPKSLDTVRDREEIRSYHSEWLSKAYSDSKHWLRGFRIYTLKHGGVNYRLIPVHLLSPWGAMSKVYSTEKLIWESTYGTNSPLGHQIQFLRSSINSYLGSWTKDPILMIGDFNVPKSLYGITPNLYSRLASGFSEAHFGNPDTFPTMMARHTVPSFLQKISIKIDHALLNSKLERVGAHPIHLRGSDHYPIYVVVKPKPPSFFGWF